MTRRERIHSEIFILPGNHNQHHPPAGYIRSVYRFPDQVVLWIRRSFNRCSPARILRSFGSGYPLAVLVSITIAAIIVIQDWKKIHVFSAGWLVLSTLFGVPLGLLLLTTAHQQAVKAALGLIIIAFAAYSLIGRAALYLKSDSRPWLLACGFLAGVLGGGYGMNGPPLAVYGTMRRWSAQHFRATLQGYFLPASIIAMAGYWLAGLWTHAVTRLYLWSLPGTFLAVLLGRVFNRRLREEVFLKYIYAGLIAIGVTLLVQAISG
jgi:uncharacterized protein